MKRSRKLYEGISEALREFDLRLLGGDTNSSDFPWISIAVIGYITAKKPPSRRNAKPGDLLLVTGRYGAMGYITIKGVEEAGLHEWVIQAPKRPKPISETAMIIASNYRGIHASIDVSN